MVVHILTLRCEFIRLNKESGQAISDLPRTGVLGDVRKRQIHINTDGPDIVPGDPVDRDQGNNNGQEW